MSISSCMRCCLSLFLLRPQSHSAHLTLGLFIQRVFNWSSMYFLSMYTYIYAYIYAYYVYIYIYVCSSCTRCAMNIYFLTATITLSTLHLFSNGFLLGHPCIFIPCISVFYNVQCALRNDSLPDHNHTGHT